MRRRSVLAAAVTAVAVGLTGCGIPDESKVRDIGPGPEFGEATTGGAEEGPPDRAAATTKEGFVSNFLAAVAGEPDKVEERYKAYLTENEAKDVTIVTDAGVNIVRVREPVTFTELGQGSYQVKLNVDHVGVLNAQGSVGEANLRRSSYEFKIAVQSTDGGTDSWIVTERPVDYPLMSTEALEKFYRPRQIYFWSLDRTTLVPDERYMPGELDRGRQPTRIVDWLIAGPSSWLRPSVSRLNDRAESKQNVPYPKDRLEVALNSKAAEQPDASPDDDVVAQLGLQFMWSLRPYLGVDLQLWVDGQTGRVFTKDQAFYAANAANRAPDGPEREDAQPERFALLGGKIHRLRGSPGGGTQPLPQMLLTSGVNQGVVSAALARELSDDGLRTAAALVAQDGDGYVLRVATAVGDGARPPATSERYSSMGRAVWLKAPMEIGLVVVDKSLYQFDTAGGLTKVALPASLDRRVVDVSAAPDGRRIAVVANGRVHVLGISRQDNRVRVEGGQPVPTTLSGVSAVDWSEETKLVVAGTGPDQKPAVWEVSLDGAIEKPQFNDTGGTVRHLVAYPDDPIDSQITATVMYSRDGAAFDLDGIKPGIEASEVMGATGDVDPAKVTAPFFLLD